MSRINRFINPNDPDNSQLKKTIEAWVRQRLNLSEATTVSIEEHACPEPTCIHTETILSIQTTGADNPQYFKITKPLVFIRKWDIYTMQPSSKVKTAHRH